jgi:hypothetical protein
MESCGIDICTRVCVHLPVQMRQTTARRICKATRDVIPKPGRVFGIKWVDFHVGAIIELNIMKELIGFDDQWDQWFLISAAERGDMESIEFIYENYPQVLILYDDPLCKIIDRSSIKVIMRLVEMGCPLTARASAAAAFRGNLDIMKYLHSKGCPWFLGSDTQGMYELGTFDAAVFTRNMNNIEWLHMVDCPWGKRTMFVAVAQCNIPLERWLGYRGCPAINYNEVTESFLYSFEHRRPHKRRS